MLAKTVIDHLRQKVEQKMYTRTGKTSSSTAMTPRRRLRVFPTWQFSGEYRRIACCLAYAAMKVSWSRPRGGNGLRRQHAHRSGMVLGLTRMNRILEIDEET